MGSIAHVRWFFDRLGHRKRKFTVSVVIAASAVYIVVRVF